MVMSMNGESVRKPKLENCSQFNDALELSNNLTYALTLREACTNRTVLSKMNWNIGR